MGDGRPGEPTEAELTDRQGQRSGTGFSKLFVIMHLTNYGEKHHNI